MNKKYIIIIVALVLIILLFVKFSNKKEEAKVESLTKQKEISNLRVEEITNELATSEGRKYNVYDETTNELIVTLDEDNVDSAYMYQIDPDYKVDFIHSKDEANVMEY